MALSSVASLFQTQGPAAENESAITKLESVGCLTRSY